MNVIVCLDDKNGMLFNKRRQSSDRELRARVLEITAGYQLWMNAYSAQQFTEAVHNLCVDEDFLSKAEAGEYCFVENSDVTPHRDRVEQLIVYRWNKAYPSDVTFPLELFADRAVLKSRSCFVGYSHNRITEEVYKL